MQSENPLNKFFVLKNVVMSVCLLGCLSAFSTGISGKQSAKILVTRNPNGLISYSNEGYRIDSNSHGLVDIHVNASPLRYNYSYPCCITDPEALDVLKRAEKMLNIKASQNIIREADKLKSTSRDYYHAVDSALNWVVAHFVYSEKRDSLLKGNCVDVARLTVNVLAEMGIPARVSTGVMVDKSRKVIAGAALHTVVEIYYPDLGWIFSDPLATHHFVSAEFVYLGETSFSDYLGVILEKKKVVDNYRIIDILNDKVSIRKRVNLFRY